MARPRKPQKIANGCKSKKEVSGEKSPGIFSVNLCGKVDHTP